MKTIYAYLANALQIHPILSFLKIKKPIFINIYKGSGSIYNYEPIAMNLSLFYEYQKEYIKFMVKRGDSSRR